MDRRFRFIGVGIVSVGLVLSGCSSMKPLGESDQARLEKQLAETNKRVDDVNHKLSVLQFMVDNHQRSITAMEQDSVTQTAPAPPQMELSRVQEADAAPRSPGTGTTAYARYYEAMSVYKNGDFDKAASLFQTVADSFPADELADNALYWTGECYYAQKDYQRAINAFKYVAKKYPKGSKVPDAYLKTGYAYLALGDRANAQAFLKQVVKQYPFTPAGSKAGEMLKKIQPK
jgi:tol-pal system protein YbgF